MFRLEINYDETTHEWVIYSVGYRRVEIGRRDALIWGWDEEKRRFYLKEER